MATIVDATTGPERSHFCGNLGFAGDAVRRAKSRVTA
jgi:hypothetical protein